MKHFLARLTTLAALLFASPAFATGLNMQCPLNNTVLITPGGTSYTTGATGSVGGVVAGQDAVALTGNGCVTTPATLAADGLVPRNLALLNMRNTDGSSLAAAAAAGKFGSSITLGTSQYLVGEAAQGNTKTDDAILEVTVPDSYIAGQNLTVTVYASLTGSGTNNASTVQVLAYNAANAGTEGADIGPGAALAITAAGADKTFTITGTGLVAGQKLMLKLEVITIESGGASTLTARVGSLRIS